MCPHFSHLQHLATYILFSASMNSLFQIPHGSKVHIYFSFCTQPHISSSFIYVIPNGKISFLWLIFHHICTHTHTHPTVSLFIHTCVDGHLGSFYTSTTVNASVSTGVQIRFSSLKSFLFFFLIQHYYKPYYSSLKSIYGCNSLSKSVIRLKIMVLVKYIVISH